MERIGKKDTLCHWNNSYSDFDYLYVEIDSPFFLVEIVWSQEIKTILRPICYHIISIAQAIETPPPPQRVANPSVLLRFFMA